MGAPLSGHDQVERFTELGLRAGDVVLMHSCYKALGPMVGGPSTVIVALERAIGAAGTLIMGYEAPVTAKGASAGPVARRGLL